MSDWLKSWGVLSVSESTAVMTKRKNKSFAVLQNCIFLSLSYCLSFAVAAQEQPHTPPLQRCPQRFTAPHYRLTMHVYVLCHISFHPGPSKAVHNNSVRNWQQHSGSTPCWESGGSLTGQKKERKRKCMLGKKEEAGEKNDRDGERRRISAHAAPH